MLREPADAMEGNLGDVQTNLNQVSGSRTTGEGLMAVAQVQATCALVHAVRELTAEVRKLNQQESTDA